MKKLVWFLIMILIITSGTTAVLAADNTSTGAAGKVQAVTIEKAQEIAVANSRQAVIDDLDIKTKESLLEEAKVVQLNPDSGPSQEVQYKKDINPIVVELNLEMAKRNKENNIESLKTNVYKSALNILLLEKSIEKEKFRLEILESRLASVKIKFKLGQAAESDISDAELSVDNQNENIGKLNDNLDISNLSFANLLNMGIGTSIRLKDDIVYSEIANNDLEELIKNAIDNSSEIYRCTKNVEVQEKSFENISHYSRPGDSGYESAQYYLETAKKDLDAAKINLELNIRNKYNDLLNKADSLDLAERYEKLAQKKYDTALLKYGKGLLSKDQLLNAKMNYIDAQYAKYSAICDYDFTKADFEALIQ